MTTAPPDEVIGAEAAADRVGGGAALHVVVAAVAGDRVAGALAVDDVVVAVAVEAVIATGVGEDGPGIAGIVDVVDVDETDTTVTAHPAVVTQHVVGARSA